jgi:hypothetical protein
MPHRGGFIVVETHCFVFLNLPRRRWFNFDGMGSGLSGINLQPQGEALV